ncbi:hypothetical protein RD792_009344 [Penstemon davidsonii]|uniref:Transcription factor CBF/NF-Y/archaeal histone domain-containing protein n=1 Tax=Penstemon davidsonii TaxID=160366 RepID=A0ABR0CYT1_9LAMI|nr:hypothetical protein RD792_009344 [Penstemon davidsonii]
MVDKNTEIERSVHHLNNNNYYTASGVGDQDELGGLLLKEQDRLLPIANVGRIMKQILPPNAKISKEAKETMQECVSEFISFVTGEASDKCHKEKRKTVNGDDICWALGSLGFDDYSEPLKRYLSKFREAEGERANQNKGAAVLGININNNNNNNMEEELFREEDSSSNGRVPFSFNLI